MGIKPCKLQVCEQCQYAESPILEAALNGHLDCMKWAHTQGLPWIENTTFYAAQGGNVSILRYAHENGCSMPAEVTQIAAAMNHLECLRYAHENGCPWHPLTTVEAIREKKSMACLRYAVDHGCPWHDGTTNAAAHSNTPMEFLVYVHEQGCPWSSYTLSDVVCDLPRLRWMFENGAPPFACSEYETLICHYWYLHTDADRSLIVLMAQESIWESEKLWPLLMGNGLCPPPSHTNASLTPMWREHVRKRLHVYMEELMAKAWHPKRALSLLQAEAL